MTEVYQTSRPPRHVLPKLFVVLRCERNAGQFTYEAYFNATHVAEWLIDGKSRLDLIKDSLARCGKPDTLPLSEPDWEFYRDPSAYTAIPGEVVGVRATWPGAAELAL